MVLKKVGVVALTLGLGFGLAATGCGGDDDSAGGALDQAASSVESGVTGDSAMDAVSEAGDSATAEMDAVVDSAEDSADDAMDATTSGLDDAKKDLTQGLP